MTHIKILYWKFLELSKIADDFVLLNFDFKIFMNLVQAGN